MAAKKYSRALFAESNVLSAVEAMAAEYYKDYKSEVSHVEFKVQVPTYKFVPNTHEDHVTIVVGKRDYVVQGSVSFISFLEERSNNPWITYCDPVTLKEWEWNWVTEESRWKTLPRTL
jgi:hypothetical protein